MDGRMTVRRTHCGRAWGVGLAIALLMVLGSQALAEDAPVANADLPAISPTPPKDGATAHSAIDEPLWTPTVPAWGATFWTIDYRFRTLCDSATAYQFGMPEYENPTWSPLSRLNFPINSSWHGVRIGVERQEWSIHFEWMRPQQGISGQLADYDWDPPNPDGSYTDLGYCDQRWIEGQMLDFGGEFRLTNHIFSLPIEVWPTAGYRWQRFDIMTFNLRQVLEYNVPIPDPVVDPSDCISFNQQYHMGYFGSQFRTKLESGSLPPVLLTFQADWAYTNAYNVDHHLLREGDRYTIEATNGDSWHLSLIGEVPFNTHLALGFQADYLEIHTQGTHRWLNVPEGVDETWTNGVSVTSHQTWLTAYVRVRF